MRVVRVGISLDRIIVIWVGIEIPRAAPLDALLVVAMSRDAGLAVDPFGRIGIVCVSHDSVTIITNDLGRPACGWPCHVGRVLSN